MPSETVEKYHALTKQVRPLGHPRAAHEDVIGALIDAANPTSTAKALDRYRFKLGKALQELETDETGSSESVG